MKTQESNLKNGLKLILVERKDAETAAVLLIIKAGSRLETEKTFGVAHFLEHMVLKGTKSRPSMEKIAGYLDEIGGDYNAFTGKEYTGFHAHVSKKHADRGLDFVTDLVTRPLLRERDFELEKGVILEEIKLHNDMPISKVNNLFHEAIFGSDPLAHSIAGSNKSINNMQILEVRDFYKKYYTAPNSALIIVADGPTLKKYWRKIEKYVELPTNMPEYCFASEVLKTGPRIKFLKKNIKQGNVIIGFSAPAFGSPERLTMDVLTTLFGEMKSSRLFIRIREKLGLCYFIQSAVDSYQTVGIQISQASIDPQNLLKVIRAILKEYRIIKTEKVPAGELRKTKEYMKGKLTLSLEDNESVVSLFGHQWALAGQLRSPEKIMQEIDSVTADDILKLANKYFTKESLTVAVVSPEVNGEEIKGELDKFK